MLCSKDYTENGTQNGWKVFKAPHAYTSIFLTEKGSHTCFVPGLVSTHTSDSNPILKLRAL